MLKSSRLISLVEYIPRKPNAELLPSVHTGLRFKKALRGGAKIICFKKCSLVRKRTLGSLTLQPRHVTREAVIVDQPHPNSRRASGNNRETDVSQVQEDFLPDTSGWDVNSFLSLASTGNTSSLKVAGLPVLV